MTTTGGSERACGRSVVSALHVHSVFLTKYLRGVLRHEHLDLLEDVFAQVGSDFSATSTLVESDRDDDHVHLIEYRPTLAIPALVNSLKCVSSRHLRSQFEMRTHQDHLGSPFDLATSADGASFPIIRQHFEAQRGPT